MANTSIKLYTFNKKVNSTAQPSGSATDVSGIMIDNTSILRPSFRLQLSGVPSYNYAYISDFGRYYFIDDWQIDNGFWIVSMHCDVLASFKTEILGGTHYVLRSASSSDGTIVDNLYPMKGPTQLIKHSYSESPFKKTETCSIVGFINNSSTEKFGAVSYMKMSEASIGGLMDYLLGGATYGSQIIGDLDTFLQTISSTDIANSISRSIVNPEQYITESYMLPYTPDTTGPAGRVNAGWFLLPPSIVGQHITADAADQVIGSTHTLTFTDHPQAAIRGTYLNLAPYTTYWLNLGPFGIYPVDSKLIFDTRQVQIDVSGDLMGNVMAKISTDSKVIDILHANVKCNFPVAQTTMDMAKGAAMAGGIAIGAARAAMGDPSGIVSAASGIVSAVEGMLPQVRSNSTQGSFMNVYHRFEAYQACNYIVDDMNTERGRPLCLSCLLSTLTGYCLCEGADAAISGTSEEVSKVNDYLNSGFFIE